MSSSGDAFRAPSPRPLRPAGCARRAAPRAPPPRADPVRRGRRPGRRLRGPGCLPLSAGPVARRRRRCRPSPGRSRAPGPPAVLPGSSSAESSRAGRASTPRLPGRRCRVRRAGGRRPRRPASPARAGCCSRPPAATASAPVRPPPARRGQGPQAPPIRRPPVRGRRRGATSRDALPRPPSRAGPGGGAT